MNFTNKINIDCYTKDLLITEQIEIDYEIDFDMRGWGIKDINVITPEQTITLLFEDEDTGEEYEKDYVLKDVKINYIKEGDYLSIFASRLEINEYEEGNYTVELDVII